MTRLITILTILAIIITLTVSASAYTNDTRSKLEKYVENSVSACDAENKNALLNEINAMSQLIKKRHSVLSLYVRHDEIEKLETHQVNLETYAELGEFESAKVALAQIKFISNHIYERETLSVDNLF